jgi:hypothetical protein
MKPTACCAKKVRHTRQGHGRAAGLPAFLPAQRRQRGRRAGAALENKSEPSPDRVQQTRETMAQLNDAFTRFADELHEPQLQTLDLDLKVLNDALRHDLEQVRR